MNNKKVITLETTWKETTPGGTIYDAGNSQTFKTGDWRSKKPKFIADKCKQCGLCVPVCPDNSIPYSNGIRTDFDYDMCKGCGVCAQVCPFAAIEME
jgi:2-oxoacid:acceptor oxidoreductase, delta subunit, pyruvate/2-ketoisovalerate family